MEKEKMHYLYVLKCEEDSFYIGVTTNVNRRFRQHESGKGANFTRRRKPLSIHKVARLGVMTLREAEKYEDACVIQYIRSLGADRCKGGRFFTDKVSPKNMRRIYDGLDSKYKNIVMDSYIKVSVTKPKHKRTKKGDAWSAEIRMAKMELARSSRQLMGR